MPVNDYLPFATSPGATVLSQPNYAGLTARGTGFQQGIADEYSFNKAMRQASMAAAVLAQFTVDNSGQDLFDDGNVASWEAKLVRAIANSTSNVLFGSGGFRTRLPANINLYVNGTTGNDANTGLSPTTALATPQAAWNLIITSYDLNNKAVQVNIADGTYNSLFCAGLPPGYGALSRISFIGNTTTPTSVHFIGTNQNAITAASNANISIAGMYCTSSGTISLDSTPASNVSAASNGAISIIGPINFGACPGIHLWATQNGNIGAQQVNYTISGGALHHYLASAGATVNLFNNNVTLTGTPNFVSSFAGADDGYCQILLHTFSGPATGLRYSATLNGIINTNLSGPNYFPGSISGQVSSGGQYS